MEAQNTVTYRYDAFISYSHANANLAAKISKRIRRYRPPKQIKLKKRQLSVFRDVERLTAAPLLSEELKKNLKASKRLILLASPDSADSDYVNDEINFFLQHNRIDSVIIVLVEGEFQKSISPSLARYVEEPLYIELLKGDSKSFRAETLRILAALFEVDYAKLLQEDESLRRRKRNTWISGIFMAAAIISSTFLIFSVNPETWIRIPQSTNVDNIMPVHEIAVNKQDPSIILYRGLDANWATNPVPEGYTFEILGEGFHQKNNWDSWHSQVLNYFQNKTDTEVKSIAKIEFKINEKYDGQTGQGTINLYPAIDFNNNAVKFFKTLNYAGKTKNGHHKTLMLQATLLQSDKTKRGGLFDIHPWPMGILEKLELYSYNSNIKATITNTLIDEKWNIEFEPRDADDGYWEWVEIWNPANIVFSNRDSEILAVGEEVLSSVENEPDLWASIIEDEQWTVYNEPVKLSLGGIYGNDKEDIERIIEKIPSLSNKDDLVKQFRNSLKAEFNQVHFINDTSTQMAQILEFTGQFDTPEHETESLPQWLFRPSDGSDWIKVELPIEVNSKHRILNVRTLNEEGTHVILLTNSKGLFRTLDAGNTWQEINFGEASFIQGDKLKIVVTQSPSSIHVLVDRNQTFSEGENPLFKLKKRNWIERWRAGFVKLLED